ncbi:MAG: regulatory protein RecX, partial [Microbacteriaceae bacterium]|nr:regulatory protein RecX [Microbacteriaceae bacterium]
DLRAAIARIEAGDADGADSSSDKKPFQKIISVSRRSQPAKSGSVEIIGHGFEQKVGRKQCTDASPETLDEVREIGVKLLSRKPLSAAELSYQLQQKHCPAEFIAEIVAEFEKSLYIDEQALVESIVANHRGRRGMSRAQISRKLSERRVRRDIADQALATLDEEEEQSLLQAAAQDRAEKLADLDYDVALRRLLGYLARRGWGGYQATEAAKNALASAQGGSGVRFR